MSNYFFRPVLRDLTKGARLEYIRMFRYLDEKNVAEYFGLGGKDPARTIRNYEHNDVQPSDARLEELANYAKKERDNDERPAIKTLPNIADYDYIFIGYPMWWYTYPQIIRTFIESVDLSGKTIIPFNTHEGSGDGGTYKELQEALPNSKVLIGLPIRGQNLKDYDQKGNIKEWLDSLKINWSE